MRKSSLMVFGVLLLVLQSVCVATAQQFASAADLRKEIDQLQNVVNNSRTPNDVKPSDLKLLAEKRAQLRISLQNQIGALRRYQSAYQFRFSAKENQSVSRSIQLLETELQNLEQRRPLNSPNSPVQPGNRALTSQSHTEAAKRNAPVQSKSYGVGLNNAQPELPYVRASMSRGEPGFHGDQDARRSKQRDECEGISSANYVYLDWRTGIISPSRLKRSGKYCFVLSNANTILYSYNFTVNVQEPQGSPLGILKDAITAIKDLKPAGAAPAAAFKAGECSLKPYLATLKQTSTELETALSAMLPATSNGKIASITLETTQAAWVPVETKFKGFAAAAIALETHLGHLPDGDVCQTSITDAQAALKDFYQAHAAYVSLKGRVNNPPEARFNDDFDSTSAYDVIVREQYEGRQTAADAKTYHLNAAYSIISSSAGFMLTQVPARSYSSVTAPNPANPTTTQNVLGVDFAGGRRLVLTALLHYNFPFFVQRQIGFGVSAGPVFDISGGKADTSRFGFFAGPSVRLSQWVYLTPGFHVGEFADFPPGFSGPGQVIPTGTGTPTPVKRYTTRFAFGITFKVKDLVGSNSGGSGSSSPAPQSGEKK